MAKTAQSRGGAERGEVSGVLIGRRGLFGEGGGIFGGDFGGRGKRREGTEDPGGIGETVETVEDCEWGLGGRKVWKSLMRSG